MREDTRSTTEAGAEYAERMRAQSAGEDRDDTDLTGTRPSTWKVSEIPQHVWDDVANAPTDGPPF